MMPTLGSRPCPACDVAGTPTGTDWDGVAPCRCCKGTLWFPYPWELPGDREQLGRAGYTREEDAVITAAPSNLLAYIGYVQVYGPDRSYLAIKEHRRWRRAHPDWRPAWSDGWLDIVDAAPSPQAAISALSAAVADTVDSAPLPSPQAIAAKWRRLHPPAWRHAGTSR